MMQTIRRPYTEESLAWALSQLIEEFAAAIMPVTIDPVLREAYVSPENLTTALLSQVSYGAVIADVCEKLGVAPRGVSVRRSVTMGYRPLPSRSNRARAVR